jgi:hypothetical protein
MTRRWTDAAFEDFWAAYPRKVGKLAAKREWDRLRPSPDVVKQMGEALTWQIPLWTDPSYTPHPRTWLHQGRWMDEPPAKVVAKIKPMSDVAAMILKLTGNGDFVV